MGGLAWKVSLHGGHSGAFCEHARGTLRETLEAAVEANFHTYGVTEHAPRYEERHLYASERAKGYTPDRLQREFDAYAAESRRLQCEFSGRLSVLRGFETEVVPSATYVDRMRSLRERHGFDYVVGSVHHVNEISIDESPAVYSEAVESCQGLEAFAETYYGAVERMIEDLRPEVLAHLDLLKLHAPADVNFSTPRVRKAATRVLEAARAHRCMLDLNTAAWRKGLAEPYPAPWLVEIAVAAGIPFCFGDDSHGPDQVGFGIERAKDYLLALNVAEVCSLEWRDGALDRRAIALRD